MTDTPVLLIDGDPAASWTMILAHGAGQSFDSPWLTAFAVGIATTCADVQVWRFNFPYMERSSASGRRHAPDREPVLINTFKAVIDQAVHEACPRSQIVIGGKSLGGRIASMVATSQNLAGLVCLGYPFHPPAKPDQLRTAHFEQLALPTLICQGERDPFGTRAEIERYALGPNIRFHWLPDGDHNFRPRKTSAYSQADNIGSAVGVIADFLKRLS